MKQHNIVDIWERYLTHLLDSGEVHKAADLCGKFIGQDARLWERWIYRFAKLNQLKAIAPHIPIKNPQLTETVYEVVLNYFLTNDENGFYQTVSDWPCTMYYLPHTDVLFHSDAVVLQIQVAKRDHGGAREDQDRAALVCAVGRTRGALHL